MDYNLLIDKSQLITKSLDTLQDKTEINDKESLINNTLQDLKSIVIELEKEKFKITNNQEKEKIQFTNIDKINAIKEYCRRYEGTEISTQTAECYINNFIFYVDTLPQDIPDFNSVYDIGSCYMKPL